jgi:hypothetical protein
MVVIRLATVASGIKDRAELSLVLGNITVRCEQSNLLRE